MKESDLVQDISQEQFSKLNVQTLESIKASMEFLAAKVSDMAVILEALEQEFIKEPDQEMN